MELIQHDKYKELCDIEYNPKDGIPKRHCVVYVPLDTFYEFCRELNETNFPALYVVVSASSDFSFVEQAKNPVWKDMNKWIHFLGINESLKYSNLCVPPRCYPEYCNIDDKYSVKVYSFTKATINRIPKQIIKWFCTNNDIKDNRIVNLPFGIPNWTIQEITNIREQKKHLNKNRENLLYVNFQNNHLERLKLKSFFRNKPGCFVQDKQIEKKEYIEHLCNSKFVLSPEGNGFDCFRTLESIYCGAIPIVPISNWSRAYNELNTWMVENMYSSLTLAKQEEKNVDNTNFAEYLEGTAADFNYWRNQINESRKIFNV